LIRTSYTTSALSSDRGRWSSPGIYVIISKSHSATAAAAAEFTQIHTPNEYYVMLLLKSNVNHYYLYKAKLV